MSTHPLKHFQWPEAMYHGDRAFGDRSPHLQTQGSGRSRPPPAPLRPEATCGEHVVGAAMRGARSRRPDASTRGGVAHWSFFFFFPDDGTKEETGPSPRRSQAAAGPRPSRLLEPSACRGAPPDGDGRKGGRGAGGGGGGHARQARRATREARGRRRCAHPSARPRQPLRPGPPPAPAPSLPPFPAPSPPVRSPG